MCSLCVCVPFFGGIRKKTRFFEFCIAMGRDTAGGRAIRPHEMKRFAGWQAQPSGSYKCFFFLDVLLVGLVVGFWNLAHKLFTFSRGSENGQPKLTLGNGIIPGLQ